jgi:hypothetical protein
MDEYSEVVSRLFRLGILNGLGPLTSTVGIGDGGIGLMESMADAFPNFRFILDYYHLAEHVHGAAAAAGLTAAKNRTLPHGGSHPSVTYPASGVWCHGPP